MKYTELGVQLGYRSHVGLPVNYCSCHSVRCSLIGYQHRILHLACINYFISACTYRDTDIISSIKHSSPSAPEYL